MLSPKSHTATTSKLNCFSIDQLLNDLAEVTVLNNIIILHVNI